MLFTCFSCSYN